MLCQTQPLFQGKSHRIGHICTNQDQDSWGQNRVCYHLHKIREAPASLGAFGGLTLYKQVLVTEKDQDATVVQIRTRSSLVAFSPKLLRTFSTRARRPERESRRFTTLSKSPMNILYLSNSFGLHSSLINSSTSSPRALFILMSASRPSLASFRISSLWVKLPMSSACQKGNTLPHRLLS